MKTNKLLLAMVLGTGGSLLAAGTATDARAQGATTGALQGRVTDAKTGEALAGVTIVATSGQASQTTITEEDGTYKITDKITSKWHTFLGVSYPSLEDQRAFPLRRARGEVPAGRGIGFGIALHGHAIIQDLRRVAGLRSSAFRGVKVETDKLTRALSWANLAEEGRVILVRGPWNSDFIEEAVQFPRGPHDDQIDAVSLAVNMLSQPRFKTYGF